MNKYRPKTKDEEYAEDVDQRILRAVYERQWRLLPWYLNSHDTWTGTDIYLLGWIALFSLTRDALGFPPMQVWIALARRMRIPVSSYISCPCDCLQLGYIRNRDAYSRMLEEQHHYHPSTIIAESLLRCTLFCLPGVIGACCCHHTELFDQEVYLGCVILSDGCCLPNTERIGYRLWQKSVEQIPRLQFYITEQLPVRIQEYIQDISFLPLPEDVRIHIQSFLHQRPIYRVSVEQIWSELHDVLL